MKDILILTKVLYKNALTKTTNKKNIKSGLSSWLIIFAIMGIIALNTYTSLTEMTLGYENIYLKLTVSGILILIVFQNIVSAVNIMYFAKDIDYILPLPVKSWKLVVAKINCLLLANYILVGIYFIPFVLTYGIFYSYEISFYLIGLFIYLLLPIIPLYLTVLVISLIIRFTKFLNKKDQLQFFVSVFGVLFMILVVYATSMFESQVTPEMINNINIDLRLVDCYTNALINYDNINALYNLIKVLCINVVVTLVSTIIINKFYYKIITKISNGGKVNSKKIKNKEYNSKSILGSYINKEFKILIKNPIFFMQCIAPMFIFPILIFVTLGAAFTSGDESVLMIFAGETDISWLAMRLFLIVLIYAFNFISVTAFSREGTDAVLVKYLPVKRYIHVIAKIIPGIVFNFTSIIGVLAFEIYINGSIDVMRLITLLIISVIYNVAFNIALIYVDLKRPKLIWDNEYSVVKQNMNMVKNIVYEFYYIVMIVVPVSFVRNIQEYIIVVSMLPIILSLLIILKNHKKLFDNIIV